MTAVGIESRRVPPPWAVAVSGWALPGLGYWLIGHRGRGATVGVAVVALFVLGLLIGGVRVLEVPTYTRQGVSVVARPGESGFQFILREVGSKPWSVAQVMTGPVAVVAGAASVRAAEVPKAAPFEPAGAESHARVNEIAVLYTAVAGMLNLLAIIDSAHRAHKLAEGM